MRRDKLASRNALGMQPVDMYFGTELGQRCWGDGSQTMREELCKVIALAVSLSIRPGIYIVWTSAFGGI